MACPGNDTIAELACRRLTSDAADELDAHLADCASCRQLVVALANASLPRILASGSAPTEPAALEHRAVLLAGERVGRYVIERLLGAGAMGLVYAARDPELDRAVALKLLHPDLDADPAAARRQLVGEAQAMARLRHANVTVVHDVGDHGTQVFIAMELVDGETLRAWLARPHPWRDIVRTLAAAGRGLAAAHAMQIVHRDFKPENVLVGRDGRVCVTDFGLARAAGSGDGSIAGTPAYMAPEQRAGAAPDPRADQYSFCITLCEALTGARPNETPATAREAPRARGGGDKRGARDARDERRGDADVAPSNAAGASRDVDRARDERRGDADVAPSDAAGASRDVDRARARPLGAAGASTGTEDASDRAAAAAARTLRAEAAGAAGAATSRTDAVRVDVPRRIQRVYERGLARDPDARFPSMTVLVDELEAAIGAPRRGVAIAIAGAAIVAAAAGIAVMATRSDDSAAIDPCASAATLPSDTWSPVRANAVRSGLAATRVPIAAATADRVVEQLDAWATAWSSARHDTCAASRVRGVESPELLDLRMACLDGHARRVGTLVATLAAAAPGDVGQAIDATTRATDLASCTGARALLEPWRVPADPALRADAEALRTQLATAATSGDLGRYSAAAATATQVADRAVALGLRAVEAEASRVVADARLALGDLRGARASFERGVLAAEATGHDPLRVLAYLGLARIEGISGNADAAERLARQARAVVDRLGDAALACEVTDAESHVAYAKQDFATAVALATRALAEYRKLRRDDVRTTSLLEFLGVAHSQLGHAAETRAIIEEEVRLREKLAGAHSPSLISPLGLLGGQAREAGKLDESIALLERAQRIVEESGLTSPAALGIGAQLASTLSAKGDAKKALALLDRVIPQFRAHAADNPVLQSNLLALRGEIKDDGGDPAAALVDYAASRDVLAARGGPQGLELASLLEDEALAHKHLQHWPAARAAYAQAHALRVKLQGPTSPDLADDEHGLGAIALAQRDPATAIAHLERALALRSGPDADPVNVAGTRFDLAQALAAARRDPSRSQSLARDARTAFDKAGNAAKVAEIDAFLRH